MSAEGPGPDLSCLPPDELDHRGARLRLDRAWPRPEGSLQLELRDDAGLVTGGRWWPLGLEPDAPAEGVVVVSLPGGVAQLHPGGVDERLPALATDLTAGGTLLGHRVGRRAVVARADGRFAKHVRRSRVAQVVEGLAAAQRALAGTAAVATVHGVEAKRVVVLEPLPGQTLLSLGGHGEEPELAAAWTATGAMLRTLHGGEPGSVERWDSRQEIGATRRWVGPSVAAGLLSEQTSELLQRLGEELAHAGQGATTTPLHRDLHDQQVLVHGDSIGLLDCDTAVVGDPALDLGNLLAHLELRVRQGLLPRPRARLAAQALLDGYGPASRPEVVDLYHRLTLLRLAGLYGWRPRWRHLCPGLLAAAGS